MSEKNRHAKQQASGPRAFLFAAMLGFAKAAQLAPHDRLLIDHPVIELPSAQQPRLYEDLPLYRGRLDSLQPGDLAGTGGLVKLYSPKVFSPKVEFASIRLLTPLIPLSSGLFQAYDISALDQKGKEIEGGVLSAQDHVLFSTQRTDEEVDQILSANRVTLQEVVRAVSQEFGSSAELPPESAQAAIETLDNHRDLLTDSLAAQLRATRHDIAILTQQLTETQRAFTETVETLQKAYDLRSIVRETPKRLTEEAIDQTVVEAAKQAAKILAKAIAAALLS